MGRYAVEVARVPQMTASETIAPAASAALPVEQYVAGLARKRMAAGVLFRDSPGRVLLVEPSYKSNWEFPGGAVEADESPWATAARELAEELGWDNPLGRPLVVDYVRPQDSHRGTRGVRLRRWRAGRDRPGGNGLSRRGDRIRWLPPGGGGQGEGEAAGGGPHCAALEAVEQGVTVLCERGRRVA
jgi:hypothetical protein